VGGFIQPIFFGSALLRSERTVGERRKLAAVNWLGAIDKTVTGLGYELVDCERAQRGLLRVFIDRAGDAAGGSITIDDCEAVTRQLQYVLEVEGVAYERLEVSSPGLDRPLKKEADYGRFAGQEIELTLKLPFNGRKKYRGLLQGDAADGWHLVFNDGKVDQVLDFSLEEVREARLVPVVNFKGRAAAAPARVAPAAPANVDVDGDRIQ
jgi:ribosome maturation factor RimP